MTALALPSSPSMATPALLDPVTKKSTERKWEAKPLVETILKIYEEKGEPGMPKGNGWLFEDPAPHPNTASRTTSLAENNPRGPVGLLIQSINAMGGIITVGCEVLLPNEAPMEIKTTPFQCLARLALAGATRRRMIAAHPMIRKRKRRKIVNIAIEVVIEVAAAHQKNENVVRIEKDPRREKDLLTAETTRKRKMKKTVNIAKNTKHLKIGQRVKDL